MEAQNQEPETVVIEERPSRMSRLLQKARSIKYWSRRKKLAIFLPLLLLVIGGVYFGFFRSSSAANSIPKNIDEAPSTIASPLTGVQVKPELAKRPVTAIMIENSLDARPQSGLQDAGVVFEAIAEGGITRFAALFQESTPQYIGPVRSVRPYYLDWVKPFEASVAHVGGSPTALEQVRNGMRDIDQFFNASYYWRVSSRYAPHNMYTSFAKLDAINKSKGYKSSSFTSWPRKNEAKLEIPTAKAISLSISGYYFDVGYSYDPTTNSYYRSEGHAAHTNIVDAAGKRVVRLHPKVVVAIVTSFGLASDGHHSKYGTIGKGTAYVFQDGGVTKAIWRKNSVNSQISFSDANGEPIAFNPGQTWLTAVTSSSAVTYRAK